MYSRTPAEHGGRGADSRHVSAVLEQAVHATHGELKVGSSGPADILGELHLLLVRRVVFGLARADSDVGLISEGRVAGRRGGHQVIGIRAGRGRVPPPHRGGPGAVGLRPPFVLTFSRRHLATLAFLSFKVLYSSSV